MTDRDGHSGPASGPKPITEVMDQLRERFPDAVAQGEKSKAAPKEEPPFEGGWAKRVRPFHTHPNTGVNFVQTEDYRAAGLQFADDKTPDDWERHRMEQVSDSLIEKAQVEGHRQARLGFHPAKEKSWLTHANRDSREALNELTEEFHQRRAQINEERRRALEAFEKQREAGR
ncbi:MAG: hypothetical protein P4L85_14115 [Paludisphaera borealis]|uniref:hypothetical protein n=1 Tax=Paludisphaera borealis TaxID=1387353 RepID=UPI00284C5519|nr:hypothetical protein [Paludisphaera borealis]MDR3620482.1 hypothetical protein [Paludisphaera borealis]